VATLPVTHEIERWRNRRSQPPAKGGGNAVVTHHVKGWRKTPVTPPQSPTTAASVDLQ
jgi:hypothetical protein